MKTLQLLIIAIILGGINTNAHSQFKYRILPNTAYQSGEYLKYTFYYGFVTGGEAMLHVKETELDGQNVFKARAVAKTSGITDRMYNVYDVYASYFDKHTGLPVKSIRNIKENEYRKYNVVTYDRKRNRLRSLLSGEKKAPENVHDIVSAFYYIRRMDLSGIQKGDIITVPTYFEDENWPLVIKFKGYKNVKIDKGRIRCMYFTPMVQKGRLFENNDDLHIYISADKNRIPIRVQMDIFLGSVKIDLISHSGLKHPLVFK